MPHLREINDFFWLDIDQRNANTYVKRIIDANGVVKDGYGNDERKEGSGERAYAYFNTYPRDFPVALADDGSGIVLPRAGYGWSTRNHGIAGLGAVRSWASEEMICTLGVIDLRNAPVPGAAKRQSPPNLVAGVDIFLNKDIDEHFFTGVEGKILAVVVRNFMRGTDAKPTAELSLQTVPQMLRGTRVFLALRNLKVWSRDRDAWVEQPCIIPTWIVATNVPGWSDRARACYTEFSHCITIDTKYLRRWMTVNGLHDIAGSLVESTAGQLADMANACQGRAYAAPGPWVGRAMGAGEFVVLEAYQKAVFSENGQGLMNIKTRVEAARAQYEGVQNEVTMLQQRRDALRTEVDNLLRQIENLHMRVAVQRPQLTQANGQLVDATSRFAKTEASYLGLQEASAKFYQKFLDTTSGEAATGEELLKYFQTWGVNITQLIFQDEHGATKRSNQVTIQELVSGRMRLRTVRFHTLRPKNMQCITGANSEITDTRIAGPFEIEVNLSHGGSCTFKYRLASDNGVIGISWGADQRYERQYKIHPHHLPIQANDAIQAAQLWIEYPCLGELAPNLLRAMRTGDVKQTVVGCLTYVWTANAYKDDWGMDYTMFPRPENFYQDWTPAVKKAFLDNIANAYAITRTHGRYFIRLIQNDALGVCLFQINSYEDFNTGRPITRWIPTGGRGIYEVAESVLSEQTGWGLPKNNGAAGWKLIMGKIPNPNEVTPTPEVDAVAAEAAIAAATQDNAV